LEILNAAFLSNANPKFNYGWLPTLDLWFDPMSYVDDQHFGNVCAKSVKRPSLLGLAPIAKKLL